MQLRVKKIRKSDKLKTLKVLHIISGFGGGISSLIWNLVRNTDSTKIINDVIAFSLEDGDEFIIDIQNKGGNVYEMPRPRKKGYNSMKVYILDVLMKNSYDAIHCHIDGWRSLLFSKYAKKAGINRFIIHAHRTSNDRGLISNNPLFIKFNRYCTRRAATHLAACGKMAGDFVFGKNTNKHDFTIIPNGVMLDKFIGSLSTEERNMYLGSLDIPNNTVIIGQIARFNIQKNHKFAIDIIREIKKSGVDFVWMFIGVGELETDIKEKVMKYGLNNYVRFLGRRSDVNNLLKLMDVMVLTSYSEGLPTVVIEAQATGTPSILSDTITRETDMGLGLLEFIPIGETADTWAKAIIDNVGHKSTDYHHIKKNFVEKSYTAADASIKYENFIYDIVCN